MERLRGGRCGVKSYMYNSIQERLLRVLLVLSLGLRMCYQTVHPFGLDGLRGILGTSAVVLGAVKHSTV